MIPIMRACASGEHKRVFGVTAAQSSKTQSTFNVIGQRLDDDPAPILYIGPTKTNIVKVIEPKVDAMLRDCPALWEKTVKGQKYTTTKKLIGGTSLRFAWAGSTTEIKSDSAALVVIDEVDEIEIERRGQGSIIPLADARHKSFPDGKTIGFSTPTEGDIDTYKHPETGIEHWAVSEKVASPIWRLWQGGTRHEFAWPCPDCGEYFVPRFKLLWWPEKCPPSKALKEARLKCPCCGVLIEEQHKASMLAQVQPLSPGQYVDDEGNIVGEGVQSTDATFWVSGLMTPFIPWGEVAANWLRAARSGDQEAIKGVLNTDLGECFRVGGDAPKFAEVRACALEYFEGDVPRGVSLLTAGVDVQKDFLAYVVRGWAPRFRSWLIEKGRIWGDPRDEDVWIELDELLERGWDDVSIELLCLDAGYLANEVYDYARARRRRVRATKGRLTLDKPFYASKVDVNSHGRMIRNGVQLWHFSTDIMKSWVHGRIHRPDPEQGEEPPPRDWFLPADISEQYCQELIAEERIIKPNGEPVWIRTGANHFLDCFDPETELLTREGWINVTEAVGYSGEFASVNLDTDEIEYQRAYATTARWHDGEMISIAGRRIDLLVTPNHRMVTTRRNPVDETARITLAKDLTIWHQVKLTARWKGSSVDVVEFPEVSLPRISEVPRRVDAGDWFEFLGWFVSEGHTKESGLSRSVVITQNPGEKQDRIRALIERMGFRYRVTGGRQIVVVSRQMFDGVAACSSPGPERGCFRKVVPDLVKSAKPELIVRFIESAMLGDGWEQNGFRTYATVSKRLADDMQELFLKTGRTGNVREIPPAPYRIRGRRGTATSTQYHVTEARTTGASLRRSNNTPIFSRVPYSGMVYCVSVPNGTLVARRNGKAAIVGNCEALAYLAVRMVGPGKLKRIAGESGRVAVPAGVQRAAAQPGNGGKRVVPKRRAVTSDDPYIGQ